MTLHRGCRGPEQMGPANGPVRVHTAQHGPAAGLQVTLCLPGAWQYTLRCLPGQCVSTMCYFKRRLLASWSPMTSVQPGWPSGDAPSGDAAIRAGGPGFCLGTRATFGLGPGRETTGCETSLQLTRSKDRSQGPRQLQQRTRDRPNRRGAKQASPRLLWALQSPNRMGCRAAGAPRGGRVSGQDR